jgi:hypothetical protein
VYLQDLFVNVSKSLTGRTRWYPTWGETLTFSGQLHRGQGHILRSSCRLLKPPFTSVCIKNNIFEECNVGVTINPIKRYLLCSLQSNPINCCML